MRTICLILALAAAGVVLTGPEASLGSTRTTPVCDAHAAVALNVAAAAKTPSGSRTTVGAAGAGQIAASLRASGGNLCTTAVSPALKAKLATIAALYGTNKTAAHQQLVALLAQIKSGTIHAPMRRASSARRAASSLCPDAQSKIKISGATKSAADLAAATTAELAGDSAGADAATAAATADFAQWAANSGANTVGDWITIAAGAQALGDESLSSSALDSARSAAETSLKKATPADPCKASSSELNCFIQANAIAQMLGADGTPDLADKLKCGEVWTFTMVLSGDSGGGAFGTFTFKTSRFIVNRTAKTISDASPTGPGWPGVAAGTYNCHGTGIPSESGTVPTTYFHYHLKGKLVGSRFELTTPSSDFKFKNPFHGQICRGFGELGVQIVDSLVKTGIPMQFTVAPGQTKATFSDSTIHVRATIEKVSG